MNIRSWLRKHPQPSKLRADGRDVVITDGKWKWADAERAILALEPSKLEALDANGAVLRACELDDGETTEETKATTTRESEIVLVARELRLAADESAQRHEGAYRYAFDAVVQMFNAQSERLSKLETAWQKMVMAAGANAAGDEDSLLGLFMQGMRQGKAEEPAPKPNGKKS